ncbi:MAG TPA: PDZ domain-containing protein [Phycisphaerae bacterium]|nr:PDZ domain-containing protein [Phycisphaerae bacterium]
MRSSRWAVATIGWTTVGLLASNAAAVASDTYGWFGNVSSGYEIYVVPVGKGGWLGVQLAPVPAAVASHLQLGDSGVMVSNIFLDSPAEKAGLQRYDVIVRVDGENVERGVEMFSRHIQNKRPGDKLEMVLYRAGQRVNVTATLAEAPRRLDEKSMKYQDDPDVSRRRLFGLRGKILRPGPDGWILDDLGELPESLDLEALLNRRWPQREERPNGSEELEEGRRVDADGNVLHVRRMPDGRIEVKRFGPGQKPEDVETRVYADMGKLRRLDPEAAELLGSGSPSEPRLYRWRIYPDSTWGYDDSLRQYQDALRDYFQRFRGEFDRRVPSLPQPPSWRRPGAPPQPEASPAEPEARFEVQPDGSITVHVQDGPTQLTMTFPDEKTFQEKAPQLYDRYRETLRRAR